MAAAGPFSVAAPAKINLYLHVTGRRGDGYHILDSLVAFAGIHDTLKVSPGDDLDLEIDGPFAADLVDQPDNLVLQAARALAALTGARQGASLQLSKRLPLASGIGGGSADAAATLKALMRLWKVTPGPADLQALALALGADVPVCLNGRAAFMAAIGEELSPAPALPAGSLVLANPGVALSSPQVFQTYADIGGPYGEAGRFDYAAGDLGELVSILKTRRYDLTPAALRLVPEIADVVAALEGCAGALMARMCGSGATCFALFEDPGEAAAATLRLAGEHPGWWIRAGSLESDINRHG